MQTFLGSLRFRQFLALLALTVSGCVAVPDPGGGGGAGLDVPTPTLHKSLKEDELELKGSIFNETLEKGTNHQKVRLLEFIFEQCHFRENNIKSIFRFIIIRHYIN
jgi:hypothetical protein